MMDNMAYQPGRGNWILHEDGAGPDVGRNNDLWSCLEDGKDDGFLSDGCVRVLNSLDGVGEWSGIEFLGDGKSFLINHQHRTQDGRAVPETTDMLWVSGLALP